MNKFWESDSQHFIFFVTYKWTHKARLLYYKSLERLADDRLFLIGPFISYKEKEVLWIQPWETDSQQLIFFVTYKWTNKLDCYITQVWKGFLIRPIHKLQRKRSFVNTALGVRFTTLHFLCNLWICTISYSACHWKAFTAKCSEPL